MHVIRCVEVAILFYGILLHIDFENPWSAEWPFSKSAIVRCSYCEITSVGDARTNVKFDWSGKKHSRESVKVEMSKT